MTHYISEFINVNAIGAVVVALIYITLCSLFKEPNRQKFNAIIMAGAGAAYFSSGLGVWELVFCSVITFLAYKGLTRYYCIGIAWVLHTCWDVIHHLYADPIIPFVPTSSAECAVCDLVLATWFFFNAPSVFDLFKKLKTKQQ